MFLLFILYFIFVLLQTSATDLDGGYMIVWNGQTCMATTNPASGSGSLYAFVKKSGVNINSCDTNLDSIFTVTMNNTLGLYSIQSSETWLCLVGPTPKLQFVQCNASTAVWSITEIASQEFVISLPSTEQCIIISNNGQNDGGSLHRWGGSQLCGSDGTPNYQTKFNWSSTECNTHLYANSSTNTNNNESC